MADEKQSLCECVFMKLPKCHMQDISRRLDLQICQACIAGRMERHLFEIKERLAPIREDFGPR